jgi:hypothetical protein
MRAQGSVRAQALSTVEVVVECNHDLAELSRRFEAE